MSLIFFVIYSSPVQADSNLHPWADEGSVLQMYNYHWPTMLFGEMANLQKVNLAKTSTRGSWSFMIRLTCWQVGFLVGWHIGGWPFLLESLFNFTNVISSWPFRWILRCLCVQLNCILQHFVLFWCFSQYCHFVLIVFQFCFIVTLDIDS